MYYKEGPYVPLDPRTQNMSTVEINFFPNKNPVKKNAL
jgi:hypothetical protein